MFEIDNCSIKKAQDGDKYELERLVRENSGLIWSIVRRFKGRGKEICDGAPFVVERCSHGYQRAGNQGFTRIAIKPHLRQC